MSEQKSAIEILTRLRKILYDIVQKNPALAVLWAVIENRSNAEILQLVSRLPSYTFEEARAKVMTVYSIDTVLSTQEQRQIYDLIEKLRKAVV